MISDNIFLGERITDWHAPAYPKNLFFEGQHAVCAPLSSIQHADELFSAFQTDKNDIIWRYLPYGPFLDIDDFKNWLLTVENQADPYFFAIKNKAINQFCGMASFLRIKPQDGAIEVGHINFSPLLQNTIAATEAMFLMMQWVFETGYRRYEWKCNSLNKKSCHAAQRLGFSYEGIFRQATIVKGYNRDTAWFAMIDKEWMAIKAAFQQYLHDNNFNNHGQQKQSLRMLIRPLLFKTNLDN